MADSSNTRERYLRRRLMAATAASNNAVDVVTKLALRVAALTEAEREIERLRAEVANLKTVMIAAAEEIHAHWDAHCGAEGYGPANLMHRLEQGIPAQYGYTAGRFAELKAEVEAKDRQIVALRQETERVVRGMQTEVEALKAALARVADEPNIDKARAIADAVLYPQTVTTGYFRVIDPPQPPGLDWSEQDAARSKP